MPGPFHAVYARRRRSCSLRAALRYELKDTGCHRHLADAGPTDTEFFERADMEDTPAGVGPKADPARSPATGFEAMMAGQDQSSPASLTTKLQGRGSRLMPDSAKAEMHRRMAEPGSAKP